MAVTSSLNRTNIRITQPCEEYAEVQKHKKYDMNFEGVPYLFTPMVFETLVQSTSKAARFYLSCSGLLLSALAVSSVRSAAVDGRVSPATFNAQ